jgi:hypothetical protein
MMAVLPDICGSGMTAQRGVYSLVVSLLWVGRGEKKEREKGNKVDAEEYV